MKKPKKKVHSKLLNSSLWHVSWYVYSLCIDTGFRKIRHLRNAYRERRERSRSRALYTKCSNIQNSLALFWSKIRHISKIHRIFWNWVNYFTANLWTSRLSLTDKIPTVARCIYRQRRSKKIRSRFYAEPSIFCDCLLKMPTSMF